MTNIETNKRVSEIRKMLSYHLIVPEKENVWMLGVLDRYEKALTIIASCKNRFITDCSHVAQEALK